MACKKDNLKDWDIELPEVQRQINWSPSKSTGKSPFEALFGFVPEITNDFPAELLPESDYVDPKTVQEEVRGAITRSQAKMKEYYDKRHCPAIKYDVGDVVLVKRLPEQTGTSTKLQVRYRGPLVVKAILPSDTYRVADIRVLGQGRKRKHGYETTAHASQMKLYSLKNEDDAISDDVELAEDV